MVPEKYNGLFYIYSKYVNVIYFFIFINLFRSYLNARDSFMSNLNFNVNFLLKAKFKPLIMVYSLYS